MTDKNKSPAAPAATVTKDGLIEGVENKGALSDEELAKASGGTDSTSKTEDYLQKTLENTLLPGHY